MGLRPKIRAPSCRWTTLSNSTRWAGVALLGLDWGQGSKMGPMLELEQGRNITKALWWGYAEARQQEDRQANARSCRNPNTSPCRTYATT